MSPTFQATLILVLPLIGFVVQILTSKRWPRQGDWIPTGAIAICCLLAWNIFVPEVLLKPEGIDLKEVTLPALVKGQEVELRGRIIADDGQAYTLATGHGEPIKVARSAALSEVTYRDRRGEVTHARGTLSGTGAAQTFTPLGGEPVSLADKTVLAVEGGPEYTFRKVYRFDGGEWLDVGDPIAKVNRGANVGPRAGLSFHFSIFLDNLTAIMLVVVTTVSFLVHLYSTGYMIHHGHHAPRYNRFFAFLGLFSFSMLGLVLTDSLFFLFVFWELVGLCSYFLIGFEFERQAACRAAIKAFITTRIGDTGFFIALMVIGGVVGSFGFAEIFESVKAGDWAPWLLGLTAVLLFIGPVGKSAQFPLHVWLPDAMEGPTPVSALIHAATMVVAGVYMVARMFPFFAGAPFFTEAMDYFSSMPLTVVAYVGAFTSIFAATIALVQKDIKKVLAYSTVSQLGYMILAMGVGSIAAGCFHLWTHAFFKACLFLGAGSVIHAVETNDMAFMGGLRKKMPVTFYTFLLSTMAIAGVPLLSGFFSKEAILTQAFMFGQYHGGAFGYAPFVMGMVTAALTPFYMFRIICLAFMGEPRDRHRFDHAHESPWTMTLPLVILAALALVGGGMWPASMSWSLVAFPLIVACVFFGKPLAKTIGIVAAVYLVFSLVPVGVSQLPAYQHHGEDHGAEGGHHDVGTADWFSNRVGNRLFFDLMAIAGPGDMVHPADEKSPAPPAHGNLVAPDIDQQAQDAAHSTVKYMSIVCAALGIGFCWVLFLGPLRNETIAPPGTALGWYRKVLDNLYYMDHFYWWLVVEGTLYIRRGFAWFDRRVIDTIVNKVAEGVMDVRTTARDVDARALGLGAGAGLMGLALVITGLGAWLARAYFEPGAEDVALFGGLSAQANVLHATLIAVAASALAAILMAAGGVRRGAAVLAGCIFALCGLMGAAVSDLIARWAASGEAAPMFASFAAHPVWATVFAVLTITLTIGVWAGVGVDGTVRFIAEKLTLGIGKEARKVQTGRLQDYLFTTLLLAALVIILTRVMQ